MPVDKTRIQNTIQRNMFYGDTNICENFRGKWFSFGAESSYPNSLTKGPNLFHTDLHIFTEKEYIVDISTSTSVKPFLSVTEPCKSQARPAWKELTRE